MHLFCRRTKWENIRRSKSNFQMHLSQDSRWQLLIHNQRICPADPIFSLCYFIWFRTWSNWPRGKVICASEPINCSDPFLANSIYSSEPISGMLKTFQFYDNFKWLYLLFFSQVDFVQFPEKSTDPCNMSSYEGAL